MSAVHKLYGVFFNGELEAVEFTHEDAVETSKNLNSRIDEVGRTTRSLSAKRRIKTVFLLETDLTGHLLFGAIETLKEAQKELKQAEALENRMLVEILEAKNKGEQYTTMPEHYWEPRQKAYLKLEASKRVVEALERERENTKFSFGG